MHRHLARLVTVLAALVALVASPLASVSPAKAADVWNPPANLVQPLGEVWNHVSTTYPDLYGFRNYGWDQVMANREASTTASAGSPTPRSAPICATGSTPP